MRKVSAFPLLALLLAGAPALGGEPPALEAVARLGALAAPKSGASWDQRYEAYTKAKAALAAADEKAGAAWLKSSAPGEAFKDARTAFDDYREKALEVAELAARRKGPLEAQERQAVAKLEAHYRDNLRGVPAAARGPFDPAQAALDARLRYLAIRPAVADALRRESVPTSGWVLGIFAALLLWGGMAVCILIAVKAS